MRVWSLFLEYPSKPSEPHGVYATKERGLEAAEELMDNIGGFSECYSTAKKGTSIRMSNPLNSFTILLLEQDVIE